MAAWEGEPPASIQQSNAVAAAVALSRGSAPPAPQRQHRRLCGCCAALRLRLCRAGGARAAVSDIAGGTATRSDTDIGKTSTLHAQRRRRNGCATDGVTSSYDTPRAQPHCLVPAPPPPSMLRSLRSGRRVCAPAVRSLSAAPQPRSLPAREQRCAAAACPTARAGRATRGFCAGLAAGALLCCTVASAEPQQPQLAVLEGRVDSYNGVIVDHLQLPADPAHFSQRLLASLAFWRAEGRRGVWLQVPLEQAALVGHAVAAGFTFHHAEPTHVMLTHWLPGGASPLPANASHQVL